MLIHRAFLESTFWSRFPAKSILVILLFCQSASPLMSQIDWVSETGDALGTSFVNSDTLFNIGGTGLNAVITVNTVSTYPKISASFSNVMDITDADNASFTLTFLNGTADITLENFENLQKGEQITVSNTDGSAITITETASNGAGRMTADGVAMTGGLPSTIVEDDVVVVNEVDNGAGTFWNATMNGITSFTWLYNAIAGTSASEGFELTINNAYEDCSDQGPAGIGSTDGASNLVLWLRADAGVEESAAVAAVDGDDVSSWLDQSGGGNDATSVAAPNYQTAQHNGFPALHFSTASSEYMNIANPANLPTGATDRSYFIVAEGSSASGQQNLLYHGTNVTGQRINLTNDNDEINIAVNGHRMGSAVAFSNGLRIASYILPSGSTNSDAFALYENGGALTESTIAGSNQTVNTGSTTAWLGTNASTGAFYEGDVCEVIIFDREVNDAELVIIHNYLGAKYGLTLDANDLYDEDDVSNGNYDYEVAGLGRTNASNLTTSGQGPAILCIGNPGDLDNNEYFIWGHDNGNLEASEFADVPGTMEARFDRVWRPSEVDASSSPIDVGALDLTWDLSSFGAVAAADLRLLVDTDDDEVFKDETPISGAIDLGGGRYLFSGITAIEDNTRFTLGTLNSSQTPLPIELLSFDAMLIGGETVQLRWETASETNNDFFTIERSENGLSWEQVIHVDGAGDSKENLSYQSWDQLRYWGLFYYRLKQTDYDGHVSYSSVRSVETSASRTPYFLVYPNPTSDYITVLGNFSSEQLSIFNMLGQDMTAQVSIMDRQENNLVIDLSRLPSGMYHLSVGNDFQRVYKR